MNDCFQVKDDKMKRQQKIDSMIPVHSEEAAIIVGKLFDKSIEIFRKYNINMSLNKNR